jgi:MOSC domain-containing protein YiiM
MIVRSLQAGKVQNREYQGKEVPTAVFKESVSGPIMLTRLGFTGDHVADTVHHGGPDKAALVYSIEHYPYWAEFLGQEPGPAGLGENITVEGLTEENACIGDIYRIGGATVQLAQPRVPCYKNNIRQGRMDMYDQIIESLRTGFYVRVLAEGEVRAGDSIELVSRIDSAPTVARANQILHREQENLEAARQLLAAEGLAEAWRSYMRKRLGE